MTVRCGVELGRVGVAGRAARDGAGTSGRVRCGLRAIRGHVLEAGAPVGSMREARGGGVQQPGGCATPRTLRAAHALYNLLPGTSSTPARSTDTRFFNPY